MAAFVAGEKPTVDGRLDEAIWREAPAIELEQHEPVSGGPTPYRTEVRIVLVDETLYFGFFCFDPEPERILVHTWERDAELENDDRIGIVFDTFLDHRTGYWFRINAVGARQDGLIAGPASASADWDGLWRAKTARRPDGWSAEIEMPLAALRHGPGDVWGFNVSRYVARDRTTLRWAALELDAEGIDMARVGELEIARAASPRRGWNVTPYALGRAERDGEPRSESKTTTTTGDVGVDVSYDLTPQLGAVLTVNTDFAETEVDAQQINLTRFPLFFQEKRPFFLDGSNLFEFGLGLDERFIPFYSRRVGLFEGEKAPLVGGVKLVGRAGRFALAALDVRADDISAAPGSNLFAGRVTFDAGEHLRLGVLGTDGDPAGVNDSSLVGVDAVWQTASFRGDKNLNAGLWGARSGGDVAPGNRDGWGFRIEYPNDLWDLSVQMSRFGDALDPALGFLPRPGTEQWNGGVSYQPRPAADGRFGWVRQFFYELYSSRTERLDGEVESWRLFTAPVNLTTQSGARLELNWSPQFERLDEPFEIVEGVVIPPGEYEFERYRLELFTPQTHSWRVGTSTWIGDWYSGELVQIGLEANWAPIGGRLALDLSSTTAIGDLPQGEFTLQLYQLRASWAFSPDLVLSSFLQYDSESEAIGANTRLRWTFRPGSDLFVVWTRGWLRGGDEDPFDLRPVSDELVVKLRWAFVR